MPRLRGFRGIGRVTVLKGRTLTAENAEFAEERTDNARKSAPALFLICPSAISASSAVRIFILRKILHQRSASDLTALPPRRARGAVRAGKPQHLPSCYTRGSPRAGDRRDS